MILVRAVICVMTILVAMKAHDFIIGARQLVFLNNFSQFFFINLVFLAICRFVSNLSAIEADWHFLKMVVARHWNVLKAPIFRVSEVGEFLKGGL